MLSNWDRNDLFFVSERRNFFLCRNIVTYSALKYGVTNMCPAINLWPLLLPEIVWPTEFSINHLDSREVLVPVKTCINTSPHRDNQERMHGWVFTLIENWLETIFRNQGTIFDHVFTNACSKSLRKLLGLPMQTLLVFCVSCGKSRGAFTEGSMWVSVPTHKQQSDLVMLEYADKFSSLQNLEEGYKDHPLIISKMMINGVLSSWWDIKCVKISRINEHGL